MKGLLALLLVVAVAFSAYNWWQVQELKREVASLQVKVQEQQQASGPTDAVVGQATRMLGQARDAINHMDMSTAQRYAESARQTLAEAGRTAGQKAGPALHWLEGQASDLGRQIQDKVNSRR